MRDQKTIIIGDVQGCAQELDDLLKACEYALGDRVIFVGDLVAKGPDSAAVVRRARYLEAQSVRGNHEEHCLRWWRAKQAGDALPRLKATHQEVCESLTHEDFEWLQALPLWLELPEFNIVVVHAGLLPDLPLMEQDPFALMNIRSIRADGRPSKDFEDGVPWVSLYKGPKHIVFGHDAMRGLQEHEFATGLDTGCVYGNALSALLLPDRKIVSVAARRVWCEPSKE